jgi:hypothetical protein
MFHKINLSITAIFLFMCCAAPIQKHEVLYMWENIDKDAISFVNSKTKKDSLCRDFIIESKKWDEKKEICEIVIISKKCLDIQYFLKVNVSKKEVLVFRPIGGS